MSEHITAANPMTA